MTPTLSPGCGDHLDSSVIIIISPQMHGVTSSHLQPLSPRGSQHLNDSGFCLRFCLMRCRDPAHNPGPHASSVTLCFLCGRGGSCGSLRQLGPGAQLDRPGPGGGRPSNSRNRLVSRILYFETQTRVRETECSDTETVMIVF